MTNFKIVTGTKSTQHLVLIADKNTDFTGLGFSEEILSIIVQSLKDSLPSLHFQIGKKHIWLDIQNLAVQSAKDKELYRRSAAKLWIKIQEYKTENILIQNISESTEATFLYAEAMALAAYQFDKYKTNNTSENIALQEIQMLAKDISKKEIKLLQTIVEATCIARNWVNEPQNFLTAVQLGKEIQKLGKAAPFKVEVWNKAKIESHKMGGLLAVNAGSQLPPTFSILEYKPKVHQNKKPLVLIGKGVVYDTGGLSLKPTENSMDKMKSDMAGAAAVAATIYAVAKAELPVYIIGLIPATDNRPGENAYTPGDVITMHSGLTVEVLNTDAEGRLILADALSYAKKLNPELVIDIATLTGAAMRAIGSEGIVFMGNADTSIKNNFIEAGYQVHERLVEFPLWEEYNNYIKSDIADIKNIGGALAGATTAGMFLQHFTDYPWLHLDIAGMAMTDKKDAYRPKNGTGVGVRLFFEFIKNKFLV